MSENWIRPLLWLSGIGGFCLYRVVCAFYCVFMRAWYAQKQRRMVVKSWITGESIFGYGMTITFISCAIIFLMRLMYQNSIAGPIFIGLSLVIAIPAGILAPLSKIKYIYELPRSSFLENGEVPNVAVSFKNERVNKIIEYSIGIVGLLVGGVLIALLVYLFKTSF